MTNLLWKCVEIFGGFLDDIAIAVKVSVGTGDTSIGKYHLWGTISEAGMQYRPCDFPAIAARTVLQDIGIRVFFSPQQLECNWLAATSFHGRWDIVFQVPKDLRKYATYVKAPVTLETITGFGVLETTALFGGKVAFEEALGPFQMELISLPLAVTKGTLARLLTSNDLVFQGLVSRKCKSGRVNWAVGFKRNVPDRVAAANFLGNETFKFISPISIRVNIKQQSVPRGQCIICYHEHNTKLNTKHVYAKCRNRALVCRYCHTTRHVTT
jgi:hypothetical protein